MVASANSWVKFFQAAGVPSTNAATYAHIFCENRIQFDMLMELNKDYLREMGISPMGDIIAILRHAKTVNDQQARERVLASEKPSVNTISVRPLAPASTIVRTTNKPVQTHDLTGDEVTPKQARRVLPEHEGKYKIKLPSGTTERSKQILAKKASIDGFDTKKKGIFDRLESDQTVQIRSGLHSKTISSSIFSRLGGKNAEEEEIDASFAGVFKSLPKKLVGVTKVTAAKQKVILIKKIPAKAATMIADEYENSNRMETREKSVSFSAEDEILEIESRQPLKRPNKIRLNKNNNIQARLGVPSSLSTPSTSASLSLSPTKTVLHRTQKTIKLKQPVKRANGAVIKTPGLRSDQTSKSIKSRLTIKGGALAANKPEVSKLINRIGRVSISSRLGKNPVHTSNGKASPASTQSSVFNRLGYNK